MNVLKFGIISLSILSIISCSKDDEQLDADPTPSVDVTNSKTWEALDLNTTEDLNRIYFTSKTVGFIAGNKGKLFKTTDGGETWQNISVSATHDLKNITFFGQKGIVNGLQTTDGGANWVKHDESKDYYTYLSDKNMMVRGSLLNFSGVLDYSSNGADWNTVFDISTGYHLNGAFNGNMGFVVSWYSGHVLKTMDKGATWSEVLSGMGSSYDDFQDVTFINGSDVLLSATKYIVKSDNKGTSFTNVYEKKSAVFRGVISYDEKQWIAVGSQGEIISTKDAGVNWKEEQISNVMFKDVEISDKYITAIGLGGKIVRKPIR